MIDIEGGPFARNDTEFLYYHLQATRSFIIVYNYVSFDISENEQQIVMDIILFEVVIAIILLYNCCLQRAEQKL